jgi:hypothetical protein
MSDPCYAAKQYLINLANGTYGKVGTKITITDNMQSHIRYALEQWDFWHERTSETVEENCRLQKDNLDMSIRLEKATKAEELVKLLSEIVE